VKHCRGSSLLEKTVKRPHCLKADCCRSFAEMVRKCWGSMLVNVVCVGDGVRWVSADMALEVGIRYCVEI
jgi:hypothetical protein